MKSESKYIISNDCFPIKAHANTKCCPLIYELIPAHGCQFECAYCDVYALNEEKTFYPITVFKNYHKLVDETIKKHYELGEKPIYYFSPKTDIFQPALTETHITHEILETLNKNQASFILVTKGRLPDSEILDLLIRAEGRGRVLISHGMKNELHARILEPNAASIEERYELGKTCVENGIPVVGVIEPILPFENLDFVKDIIKRFVEIKIDHFSIDFARITRECLEDLIIKLPELEELRSVYYNENALKLTFETGAYFKKPIVRYAPSNEYLHKSYNLIMNYAQSMGATISKCNFYKIPGINIGALERGFLCFGIYNPEKAKELLDMEKKQIPITCEPPTTMD